MKNHLRGLLSTTNIISFMVVFVIMVFLVLIRVAYIRYYSISQNPDRYDALTDTFNFIGYYVGGYHNTARKISGLPITRDMKITHSYWDYGVFHVFFDLSDEQSDALYEACKKNINYSLFPYVPSFYVRPIFGINYRVKNVSYDDGDIGCYFSSKSIAERDGISSIKLNVPKNELSIHVVGTN